MHVRDYARFKLTEKRRDLADDLLCNQALNTKASSH